MKTLISTRFWTLYSVLLVSLLNAKAQMPAPTIPDNILKATDNIGIPREAAVEGTKESINLNNGSVTFFIPALTLPQRSGPPLTLGFVYDSHQTSLKTNVSASVSTEPDTLGGTNPPSIRDDIYYTAVAAIEPQNTSTPLSINLPTLTASMEYYGDFYQAINAYFDYGARSCVTNVAFRDWSGTVHSFPHAILSCTDEGHQPLQELILEDNSADGQFYRLVATNRHDVVIYSPDGTAYHFAEPPVACMYEFNSATSCGGGYNVEYFINMPMTTMVNRVGDTMVYGSGTITDTLKRTINISSNWQNSSTTISYHDSNGQLQTVSLAANLTGSDLKIPQASGRDVGSYISSGSCTGYNSPDGVYPHIHYQYSSMPDGWLPPLADANRNFNGVSITYSSTGRAYKLLFDSFGQIVKIQYPEGGYHRFDYQNRSIAATTSGNGACDWKLTTIAHRYECANPSGACSQEATTSYLFDIALDLQGTDPCYASATALVTIAQTQVISPDGSKAVHCFSQYVPQSISSLETEIRTYSPGGPLLRKEVKEYEPFMNGSHREGSLHPNPIKLSTYIEDTDPVATSWIEMDYDSLPPGINPTRPNAYAWELDRHLNNVSAIRRFGYDGALISTTSQTWSYFTHTIDKMASRSEAESSSGKTKTTHWDYDSNANLLDESVSGTDAATSTTYYMDLDAYGRPTHIKDPRNNVTTVSYANNWSDGSCNATGNDNAYVTSITNPLGHTTSYSYNSCTGTLASSSDANTRKTAYHYDGGDRVIDVCTSDAVGALWDGSSCSSLGTLQASYTDTAPTSVTTTQKLAPYRDVIATAVFDGVGRTLSIARNPSDSVITEATYDEMGRISVMSSPHRTTASTTDGTTAFYYDVLGRKVAEQNPDGSSLQWCYNDAISNGQTNCSTNQSSLGDALEWMDISDESGRHWQRSTDALGRLRQVTEPSPSTGALALKTIYAYDGFGNLIQVAQSGAASDSSHVRTFKYDGRSRLLWSHNPETGVICYGHGDGSEAGCQADGYDANGNLLYKTDARGVTVNYSYDALNRLVSKTYSNDPANTPSTCYQYDSTSIGYPNGNFLGRLTHEWTQSGACPATLPSSGVKTRRSVRKYDAMGRVKVEERCVMANCTTSTNPFTLHFDYDLAGNLTEYDNGIRNLTLTQAYDSAGRLNKVTSSAYDATHPNTLYNVSGFFPNGVPSVFDLGLHLNTTQGLDIRLRPTTLNVVVK